MDTSSSETFNDCKAMAKKLKTYKCNQCDYSSAHAGSLRTHLKRHSGEKEYKCIQCDYASVRACHLRRHLKKNRTNATNVTLQQLIQAI